MSIDNKGIFRGTYISEVGVTEGLVGWWKLNQDIRDYSSSNNHGTNNGNIFSSGLNQKSIYINGSGNNITIPSSPENTFMSRDFSISLWYNSVFDVSNQVFSKRDASGNIELQIVSTNEAYFYIRGLVAGVLTTDYFPIPHVDNEWRHIVATRNLGVIKIYVNGTLIIDQAIDPTMSYETSSVPLYIGTDVDGLEPYEGKIQDFRIYNRALTMEEVNIMYKLTTGKSNIIQTTSKVYIRGTIKEGY